MEFRLHKQLHLKRLGWLLACVWSSSSALAPAADAPVAFIDVNVIPMDRERILESQTVIVRGDRIERIGPVDEVDIPEDAARIDAVGKFLIPGLADMHVHFKLGSLNRAMVSMFNATGVTTVFNLSGLPGHLRLRTAIESGETIGPTIFSTGPIMRGSPPADAAEAEKMVRHQKELGYDAIKLYNQVPLEAYWKAVETAREVGLIVTGHAVRAVDGIEAALKARQHVVHMEEFIYGYFRPLVANEARAEDLEGAARRMNAMLDDSLIDELARRTEEAGIYVTPNLVAYHGIQHQLEDLDAVLGQPEMLYLPRNVRRGWEADRNGYTTRDGIERFLQSIRMTFPFMQKLTAAFGRAGVPLLLGSDTGIPSIIPGYSAHDELEELVAAGLTPYEALRTGTRNAAEFFDQGGEFGRIAEGLRADLILLNANPLADITATRRRAGVMLKGQWFDQSELDASLEEQATPW